MIKNVNNHSKKNKAILALVIAAASFPLFSIGSRLVNEGFAPLTQVALRIGLGFIFASLILGKNVRLKALSTIPKKDWFTLLLMGIVGYSLSTYFTTLGALNAKLVNVSVIGNLELLFVYLYSILIFKKQAKSTIFIFIFLTLWGAAIMGTKSFVPILSNFGIGEFFVILFAATSALYLIGRQLLSNHLNNTEVTLISMLIAFLSTLFLAIVTKEPFIWVNFFNKNVLLGLAIGGSLNMIAMPLQNFAYKYLEGVFASQILLSSLLFSLLYGFLLYRELVSVPEVFGGSLIILSTLVINKLTSDSEKVL